MRSRIIWLLLIVISGFSIPLADCGLSFSASPPDGQTSLSGTSPNRLSGGVKKNSSMPAKKSVLLLFPYQSHLPQTVLATESILDTFNAAVDLKIELYVEYMDLNRTQTLGYKQQLLNLFVAKYRGKKVDLVMATSEPSLDFWLEHRGAILPDTPVVFYDIGAAALKDRQLPPDVTGVRAVVTYTPALNWILKLRPSIHEVILVQGRGEADRIFKASSDRLGENLDRKVTVTDWSYLPFSEIKRQAGALPQNTVIACHLMFEDSTGLKFRPIDVVRELAAASAVPVISGYDQFVGAGSIGGFVYGIGHQAREAARIGLRIINGESAANMPVISEAQNQFVFDHPALQRHHISLSQLPARSVIKNRQYTLWELHRLKIIGVATSLLVLILGIIFLVVLNRKLNRARNDLSRLNEDLEAKVSERTADLSQTNRRLSMEIAERIKSAGELKASEAKYRLLAENMLDVVWTMNSDGQFTYVSPSVENLRGYTPQEVLTQSPAEALTIESLQKMQALMAKTIPQARKGAKHFTSRPLFHELEQSCKDGSTVWTEALVRVLFDNQGEFTGFLGVTRNIRERKVAEAERERLIRDLQAALGRVKQMERILPICSFCKRIRDENGNWHGLESYISDHSETQFSHGFCPECGRKYYPNFFDEPE